MPNDSLKKLLAQLAVPVLSTLPLGPNVLGRARDLDRISDDEIERRYLGVDGLPPTRTPPSTPLHPLGHRPNVGTIVDGSIPSMMQPFRRQLKAFPQDVTNAQQSAQVEEFDAALGALAQKYPHLTRNTTTLRVAGGPSDDAVGQAAGLFRQDPEVTPEGGQYAMVHELIHTLGYDEGMAKRLTRALFNKWKK